MDVLEGHVLDGEGELAVDAVELDGAAGGVVALLEGLAADVAEDLDGDAGGGVGELGADDVDRARDDEVVLGSAAVGRIRQAVGAEVGLEARDEGDLEEVSIAEACEDEEAVGRGAAGGCAAVVGGEQVVAFGDRAERCGVCRAARVTSSPDPASASSALLTPPQLMAQGTASRAAMRIAMA